MGKHFFVISWRGLAVQVSHPFQNEHDPDSDFYESWLEEFMKLEALPRVNETIIFPSGMFAICKLPWEENHFLCTRLVYTE